MKPNPNCEGIRRQGLGEVISHEGGALMSGISALIKEAPESSLTLSTMWGYNEKMTIYELESGSSQTQNLPALWSWTSQPPELSAIHFCYLSATRSVIFCYSSLNRLVKGWTPSFHQWYCNCDPSNFNPLGFKASLNQFCLIWGALRPKS